MKGPQDKSQNSGALITRTPSASLREACNKSPAVSFSLEGSQARLGEEVEDNISGQLAVLWGPEE